MKHLLFLVICVILCVSYSHAQVYTYSQDNGSYGFERTAQDVYRVEEVLWTEDFAEGIPVSWTNTNYDSGANNTDAMWEYRSTSSTPDNTIGTIGNCIDSGAIGGEPITSPSADNGFLIFDSNYWDATEGNCGDFGTGISAAPHNASLTTASFDFSETPYLAVEFSQFLKNFDSVSKVQVSVGGGEFTDVFINQFTGTNAASPRDMRVRKNISALAGNESDVKIRFTFEGTYYFWMIDDIQIVSIEQNNLSISSPLHGALDIQGPTDFEDYLGMQYFKYPNTNEVELILSARAENRGGDVQIGASLITTLSQGGSELNSTSSGLVDLSAEEVVTFMASSMMLPLDLGTYDLGYTITQYQEDESPENNVISKRIEVTESTLARDEGEADSFYVPAAGFNETPYEVGAVYVQSEQGIQLQSISAAVSSSSLTGSYCYATLYGFSIEEGVAMNPIATTELQVVQFFHLNDLGDEQMMVFDFETPIDLVQDSSYLAVVGTINTPSEVLFSMSGEAQALTAWARFNDSGGVPNVTYLSRIPMVRMNFDQITSVEYGIDNPEIIASIYPNPATDIAVLEYNLSQRSELLVGLFDMQGKHLEDLYIGEGKQGNHQLTINVSSLPSGVYLVRLSSELGKLEKKLIVE
tara:strand:+ start:3080 stop:4996 length:1917 start_codon:yes stop_codon:yes gene_type:complete